MTCCHGHFLLVTMKIACDLLSQALLVSCHGHFLLDGLRISRRLIPSASMAPANTPRYTTINDTKICYV